MAGDIRITLIYDPFGIWPASESRISDFSSEKRAFSEIEDILRRDLKLETVHPRTYIIEGHCWEHFHTFRCVNGVRIQEISPRTRVRECFQTEPPEWLTDNQILQLSLLNRQRPPSLTNDWPSTIATWLVPGITEAGSLDEWFRLAASSEAFHGELDLGPVRTWFQESLEAVAAKSRLLKDVISNLTTAFNRSRRQQNSQVSG